jgi:hypothetical protein
MAEVAPSLLPLLPHRARPLGLVLVGLGAALGGLVLHAGTRPSIFDVRVFALYSVFFETRSFTWIQKNVSVELAMFAVLTGLSCITFSREAVETEATSRLRVRALGLAVLVNTLVLLVSLFTVFGVGFIYVLAANLFSTFALATLLFRASLWLERHPRLLRRSAP